MPDYRISEPAAIIARDTALVNEFCERTNVPSPVFDIKAPLPVLVPQGPENAAIAQAQENVIAATQKLSIFMRGSHRLWMNIGFADAFVMRTLSRVKMFNHVPIDGETSFEDLATRCDVNLVDLRRVMRFATTDG